MASLLVAFLFPYLTWQQAAGCALLLLLFNTMILPWLDADFSEPPRARFVPSEETPISLGERPGGASRVRGYFAGLAPLLRPRAARDPSPDPRRLVKTPVSGHPLPWGEGKDLISLGEGEDAISLVEDKDPISLAEGKDLISMGGGRGPISLAEGKDPISLAEGEDLIRPAAITRTRIILYPTYVLALILLYRNHLHIAAAAWAIMALGDGMATLVGEGFASSWRGKLAATLPWNRQKTWVGFTSFALAGTVGAYVLTRWIAPQIPPDKTLIVCAAASLLGAVVESLPTPLDDNVTVPLVVGAFMFCAFLMERSALDSNLPYLGRRILLAMAVNLAFALSARALGAASRSGAVCGFFLGTAIYLGYGYKSFLLLLAFVLMGTVATRLGLAKKTARGVAERRGGARSWREALANLLAAAFFAILVITTHHEAAFLVALVAALAEAVGDTVSSEIGQWISERAYLITTFQPVAAGEDGGISLGGTAAGFAASTLVVGLGLGLKLCGPYRFAGPAIALAAALAGNLFDSFLGATIQRRGLVRNGMVNFAGTSFAGALALGLALGLGM